MKITYVALHTSLMVLTMMAPLTLFADETRDMNPGGRLSLEAQSGDFALIGHDEDRLLIISPGGQAVQPAIGGDASHWSIRFGSLPIGRSEGGEPDLIEIRVPHSAEVEARLGQGSLSASGLHGPLVQLQVVGGSVRIRDSKPERLFIETVDAGQNLDGLALEETRLQSVGGEIRARGDGKRLGVQTLSGPVRLDIDELVDLDLRSLSGDTRVRVRPSERAVLRARSQSARLAFELPAETPLELNAESHRGEIESAFGGSIEVDQNGNRRLVHGGGPGAVRLETRSVDGPIEVSKMKRQARMVVFRDAESPRETAGISYGVEEVVGEIVVGIDAVQHVALGPGQFSVLELPLDSRQVFAQSSGLRPVVLEVEELDSKTYCFRLEEFRRFGDDGRMGTVNRGFSFTWVDCPDAGFLAEFEEVSAHPPEVRR